MPKFSVIIATYNQLELLTGCLEALSKQTFKDFDVHVCDDGSSDATPDYCQKKVLFAGATTERILREPEFPPENLRYFYHCQKNKGNFGANLNQAIGKAQGEYLVFIAADSMPELDYLEILNGYVEPYRLVCGIRIHIAEVGGEMKGVDMDYRLKKDIIPEFPAPVIGRPWNALTGNGLTVPREAFEIYGKWSEQFKGYGGEDTELIARLFFKGYVCWSVPDLRLYHRWHKSRDASPENLRTINKILNSYAR